MNKGRALGIPGIGLAGDWPGGWTQTYAQVDTEAGPHGFDKTYFVQQVAGLSQLAGEFMLVKPLVIDLGWGKLKSSVVNLKDDAFVVPSEAASRRSLLVNQYVDAFRHAERNAHEAAASALKDLATSVSSAVVTDKQAAVRALVDEQRAKLG